MTPVNNTYILPAMSKTPKNPFEQFEKIIQEAISKAERVDCPMEVFVEGLKNMGFSLQDRIDSEN